MLGSIVVFSFQTQTADRTCHLVKRGRLQEEECNVSMNQLLASGCYLLRQWYICHAQNLADRKVLSDTTSIFIYFETWFILQRLLVQLEFVGLVLSPINHFGGGDGEWLHFNLALPWVFINALPRGPRDNMTRLSETVWNWQIGWYFAKKGDDKQPGPSPDSQQRALTHNDKWTNKVEWLTPKSFSLHFHSDHHCVFHGVTNNEHREE